GLGSRGAGHQKPWNLMIKHRHVQRRGRRSHTAVSYTDPQVSMDLLRAVLQPSFNDDIMAVFRKYQKFFEKAAENVKENVGEDVQTDQLIREACRNVLEHVRSLPVSSHSSLVYLHSPGSVISLPGQTAVSRGGGQKNGVRSHDEGTLKPKAEPVKREGPKWDPSRLNDSSTFVLGSRANKALGMGGTRGRIYIKHADLFKCRRAADLWGGARCDEYRDCPDVRMDELKPFGVPPWMVEKMQRAMEAQRDNDP
uniref:Deoxynucleotidyltransferase terminal-interacting protein 1 n=1 Tax=Xiphophorus maculatus TaxID=8083 RepID=A0A3B5QQ29_XIPMA